MNGKILFIAIGLLISGLCSAQDDAQGDWKQQFVRDLQALGLSLQSNAGEESAAGEAQASSERAGAFAAEHRVYLTIDGLCSSFAGESNNPLDAKLLVNMLAVHRTLLLGESPGYSKLNQLGLGCLQHIEDSLAAQGLTRPEIESVVVPQLRSLLDSMREELL